MLKRVLGVGVVILGAALLAGCETSSRTTDKHTIVRTNTGGVLEGRPTLGMPIRVPERPTYLLPFALESEKGLFQKDDQFYTGGYSGRMTPVSAASNSLGMGSTRWHNCIVCDMKTGEQWPILTRRGVISRYEFLGKWTDDRKSFRCDAILFIATFEDSNKDGVLNDRDACVVILTPPDGRGPRIVSPDAAQVWATDYDPDTGLLSLQVVADTNKDGVFDTNDTPEPRVVDVRKPEPAKPLVAQPMLEQVQKLLK